MHDLEAQNHLFLVQLLDVLLDLFRCLVKLFLFCVDFHGGLMNCLDHVVQEFAGDLASLGAEVALHIGLGDGADDVLVAFDEDTKLLPNLVVVPQYCSRSKSDLGTLGGELITLCGNLIALDSCLVVRSNCLITLRNGLDALGTSVHNLLHQLLLSIA